MFRFLGLALACVLLLVPACGSGSSDDAIGSAVRGPSNYALPFVPNAAGESLTIGFRNLTTTAGTVYVTAYLPSGAAYGPGTVDVDVPALGGVQIPLAFFTGPAVTLGGWLEIETRDLTTLDPTTGAPAATPTSGFITSYTERFESALDSDGALGVAFRDDFHYVSFNPFTIAYQIINGSFTPGAGGETAEAITVNVVQYDAFGVPSAPIPTVIPASGSVLFVPTVSSGRIEVTPAVATPPGVEVRIAAAGLEADPQVFVEARLLEVDRTTFQRFVGFDVEFGTDPAGNVYDFFVQATNATTRNATITLEGVYRANGTAILDTPRTIAVDAKRTKLLATTNLDSQGLDTGEDSPFSDIFGPVETALDLDVVTVVFSVSADVSISARGWNRFKSFYRVLPGRKLTTQVAALGINAPVTTATGARNWISLMNPRQNEVQINIRGFTPGGTEYILESVTVPAFSRVEWSADGLLFTEDPTDPTQDQVPFMCFLMTGQGGVFFNARRTWRDLIDLEVRAIAPQVVRDLRAD